MQIEEKHVPHEDEVYYERVAAELESGQLRSGLWTKALARAMGDEAQARPLYIEWRVEQIVDERQVGGESLQLPYARWAAAHRSVGPAAMLHWDIKSRALMDFEGAADAFAKQRLQAGETGPQIADRLAAAFPDVEEERRATDFRRLLDRLRR